MVQEDVRDGEGVRQLAVADQRHRAHDADALLPERLAAARQLIEQRAVLVQQPLAQQRVARQVHEVPVVDPVGMRQVEIHALMLRDARSLRVLEDLHQRQQPRQPHLVVLARQAFLQLRKPHLAPAALHHLARHRHLDSQELIPLPILSRPGPEKPRQPRHLPRVGMSVHFLQQNVHMLSFYANITLSLANQTN